MAAVSITMDSSSIEGMWREVAARFQERTGKSLYLQPPRTLENCIDAIERRQATPASGREPEKTSKKETAKTFGLGMLKCIKLLGGVAAQGADMVFPGSSLCFNGLSMLLDIPEKLHTFHEAVDGMFETLGPSLNSFKIYDKIEQFNNIEPQLKEAIHSLMISFVDICALSIQLRESRRWTRFTVAAKYILLQKDSGVKAEIEHFQALTVAHTTVQATQSLKFTIETNSTVAQVLGIASETKEQVADICAKLAALQDSDEKRKSTETLREQIQTIKEKLDLKDSEIKLSRDIYEKLWHDCVTETANWYKDAEKFPEFQQWAERDDTNANPLFVLTGDANAGKSFLASSIVHHLQSIYETPERQLPQTLVASHFFSSTPGKADTEKRSVEVALKCIALQFANAQPRYARKLFQTCKGRDAEKLRDATCQELWDILGLGDPQNKTINYILFDGLESLPSSYRAHLFSVLQKLAARSSTVRVLLSVKVDTFEEMKKEIDIPHSVLDVGQHNGEDIRRYIDHELQVADILQESDEDSVRIRNKIRDSLSSKVGGNYFKVNTALGKIKSAIAAEGIESDIDKVLDESGRDEKAISETVIKELETVLKAEEINELNELLIWVIFGYEYFSIDELNAARFLRFKTRPLLRLEKKIKGKGKYAGIMSISANGFVEVDSGMDEALRMVRTEPRNTDDKPKFSATITITKADMASVQSFLWNFMQRAAQDSFGFKQLEEQDNIKGRIRVNDFDAHLTIVRRTLAVLAEDPDDRSTALAQYLLEYLPQHLKALENGSEFDVLMPSERQDIGDGLFLIFETGDVIDKWWKYGGAVRWYCDCEQIDTFLKWLKDKTITAHLGKRDRRWLEDVGNADNPRQALLMNIMEKIAYRWLQEESWIASQAFRWLQGFLSKVVRQPVPASTVPADDANTTEPTESPPSTEECSIEEVEEWCKTILKVTETDLLWEKRVGITHYQKDEIATAIDKFRSIIERRGPDAHCTIMLALSLVAGDFDLEGCETMEKALVILESEDPRNLDTLRYYYAQLASWYDDLQRSEQAVATHRKALAVAPDDREVRYGLLRSLLAGDYEHEAVELLDSLTKEPTEADPTSQFDALVDVLVDKGNDTMLDSLFHVISRHSELYKHTIRGFDNALSRAKKDDRTEAIVFLLFLKGTVLYHFQADVTVPISDGFECWKQCHEFPASEQWTWQWARRSAADQMAAHHFELCRGLHDASEQEEHIESLQLIMRSEKRTAYAKARTYLACLYSANGKQSDAAETVRESMHAALEMLSDNTYDNDGHGYYRMAYLLLHLGDISNAFSAFSLLLPSSAKAQALTWMLESETEREKALSLELVTAVKNDASLKTIEAEIDFVLKQLEQRESPTANDDGTKPKDTNEDSPKSQDIKDDGIESEDNVKSQAIKDDDVESKAATDDNTKPQAVNDNGIESKDTDENSAKPQDIKDDGIEPKATNDEIGEPQAVNHNGIELTAANDGSVEPPAVNGNGTKPLPTQEIEAIRTKLKEYPLAPLFTSFQITCDGECDKAWGFENEINVCKYCYDLAFCNGCLQKLRDDALKKRLIKTRVCRKTHDWLRLPKWTRERFLEPLRQNVWVDGEIRDGERVDGKLVPVSTWLDGLKHEWGYVERQKAPEDGSGETKRAGEAQEGEKADGADGLPATADEVGSATAPENKENEGGAAEKAADTNGAEAEIRTNGLSP